jgi:hypothetical protein
VVDEVLRVDLVGDVEPALVEDLFENPAGDCLFFVSRFGGQHGGKRYDAEEQQQQSSFHLNPPG